MAVALKLYRIGKKGHPTYKIVAVDRHYKSNGKYIELVGSYNPHVDPVDLKINKDKLDYWITRGAIISEGLAKLLKNRKQN